MRRWTAPPIPDIDPVGTAGTLSGISALASVAWPFFVGLAGALLVLALVAWATRGLPGTARSPPRIGAVLLFLGALGGFAWAFAPPPGASTARALGLGAVGFAVAWRARQRPPFGGG
ncbi:MAG TPA: hypothetical protein VLY85_01210 [Thermoplasmata archaeon]|nr:hypothetical protein [Thermoplasmata archaeon]